MKALLLTLLLASAAVLAPAAASLTGTRLLQRGAAGGESRLDCAFGRKNTHWTGTWSDETESGVGELTVVYRPTLDLASRITGTVGYTRANSVHFHGLDDAAPRIPPRSFNAVLTGRRWKGVVDFARADDARLITSSAIGPGTRDVWPGPRPLEIRADAKNGNTIQPIANPTGPGQPPFEPLHACIPDPKGKMRDPNAVI